MIKAIVNVIFSFFLNLFKQISCDYNVRLSPIFFIGLMRSGLKKVRLRNVIIGSGVEISNGCSFFNGPELFGKVKIGRYTSVNGPATRICAELNEVIIGSFCSIASNVVIQEFYHNYNRTTTYFIGSNMFDRSEIGQIASKGPIIIEDDVWIGSNTVILSGVTIGRGAIVGAGSVVTKSIDRYTIVGGNPAKKLKDRFSEETKELLEKSEWWLWDEQKMFENQHFFEVDRW